MVCYAKPIEHYLRPSRRSAVADFANWWSSGFVFHSQGPHAARTWKDKEASQTLDGVLCCSIRQRLCHRCFACMVKCKPACIERQFPRAKGFSLAVDLLHFRWYHPVSWCSDEASSLLREDEGPNPIPYHRKAISESVEEEDMDGKPREPGEES